MHINEETFMTKISKKDGKGKSGTEKGTVSRAVIIEGKIEQ